MKLRQKHPTAAFLLNDADTGERWWVDVHDHLRDWQAEVMSSRPQMVQDFAYYLAERARREGHPRVEVHAVVLAGLNGRSQRVLIDPYVDLAAEPRRVFGRSPWIVPLDEGDPNRFPVFRAAREHALKRAP